MTIFKSDVQYVRLSHGYSYADAVTTGRLLSQWYTLIKAVPFMNQSFFQMVDVSDPAAVHSLAKCHQIAYTTGLWPVLWPDEVLRLGRQQCNRFAITVSRGIVLLTRFCWCRQLINCQLDPASSVGSKRCTTADVWYSPFWAHNGRARQSSLASCSRARPSTWCWQNIESDWSQSPNWIGLDENYDWVATWSASPAWWGFTRSTDRQCIDAVLRRAKQIWILDIGCAIWRSCVWGSVLISRRRTFY